MYTDTVQKFDIYLRRFCSQSITLRQFLILQYIHRVKSCTGQEIADYCQVNIRSVSDELHGLNKKHPCLFFNRESGLYTLPADIAAFFD